MAKKQLTTYPSLIKATILFLLAVGIALFLLVIVIRLGRKYMGVRNDIKELRTQHTELSQKLQDITAKNAYLETAEGQERELRNKFNMVRPGESIVIITNDSKASETPPQSSRVFRLWDTLLHGLGFRTRL